jgi:predicted RNA-binding Zn-ribbon protein involved in translation (DUF1610 family)
MILVIFNTSFGTIYFMGRKVKQYKRIQKRLTQQRIEIEQLAGLSEYPKNCPQCGAKLIKEKLGRRLQGGVLAEGSGGAVNIGIPSPNPDRNEGLETFMLMCPNCDFELEIDGRLTGDEE